MGLVLEPGGNAPGTDGLPYEVYQVAPATLACLIGQAIHYAHLGPQVVRRIIGDEPDLLVWMPKPGAKE
eukprot:6340065-Lingulodinium_polyedra.AAC.1